MVYIVIGEYLENGQKEYDILGVFKEYPKDNPILEWDGYINIYIDEQNIQ